MRFAKQVADPVHHTIGLTKVELDVVNGAVFQRLRGVKQLGLAHLVFPGADYSRFAHSLGVCHVAGRFIDALHAIDPGIDAKKIQLLRLAGLLHDVGHYPFSHATEHALQDHHAESAVLAPIGAVAAPHAHAADAEPKAQKAPMDHERVGKEILLYDEEITAALTRADIDPNDVASIFKRETGDPLRNLISSDLDADRIDFLLRTSHFTGLPYAAVDLDYLVSQVRQDESGRVCFTHKALRAADHLLVGRYFDYQQVAFHKAVVGFELLLKRVLKRLVSDGVLDGSRAHVEAKIRNGTWAAFDDAFVWSHIRTFASGEHQDADVALARALVKRRPPKLVASAYQIEGRHDGTTHRMRLDAAKNVINRLEASGYEGRVFLWTDERSLTKIGARVPVDYGDAGDKLDQSCFILNKDGKRSQALIRHPSSLMSVLSEKQLYAIRLYVLFGEDARDADVAAEKARINQELPEKHGWS